MEFILIPLFLILASVGGVFFIVWRKLPNLGELAKTEGSNGNGITNGSWRNFIIELYPEFWNWLKNVNLENKFKEYKELWLVETEKFLRRLRVASLKMDRLSDSLIKKIRNSMYSGSSYRYAGEGKDEDKKSEQTTQEAEKNSREEFKKREQMLILEIAKNPKNSSFYEELGNLYIEMREYDDARNSYEAAIELNPNNEELNKKLSQALEKLNKPEGSQG